MSDSIGCEVCHGLTKNGYTLTRYGQGYRCQSHIPRTPEPQPTSMLSCNGQYEDCPQHCPRVRCQLGKRCCEVEVAA